MAESKRLYVGGLFTGVNEDQLKQRFSKFGEISGVEIKSKQSIEADQPNTFAFVDIDITPNNLVKCFSVFSNCRWKGCDIKLQVAKESFLQRLKKEKEGNINVGKTKNPNFEPLKIEKWKQAEIVEKEVKPEVHAVRSLKSHRLPQQPPKSVDVREKIVDRTFDVVERLEKFSGSVWRDQDERKETKKTDKSLLSNEKRLKSIEEKLEEAKAKEKLISNALKMTVDVKPRNNRIKFDCDEEENGTEVNMEKTTKVKSKKHRKKLFDGDEEEMEEDPQQSFELKPQFHGQSGQKLLELQARFGNDDRFRLDHRFQENDENISEDVYNDDEKESQLERSRNLEILGSIVGGPVRSGKRKSDGKTFMAKRYDPTKADCASLEVHREKIQKSVKSVNNVESEKTTEDKVEEVDPKRFYQVDSNLADLFSKGKKKDSTFSILNTFGSKLATSSTDKLKTKESDGALRTYWQRNPFSHDSSDDEEEATVAAEQDEPSADQPERSTFFFIDGDSRFKEGLAFYKKDGPNSSSDHSQWLNRKIKAKQLFKSRRKQIRRKVNSQKLLVKKKKKRLINHSKKKSKRK